jgi:hypothetical protein
MEALLEQRLHRGGGQVAAADEPQGSRRRPQYRLSPRDNTTRGEGRAAASSVRHVQGELRRVPDMANAAATDRTRELQRTLYGAAKADPGRRFHALHDKVHRRDPLERAWRQVRANRGAAGIDRQTIEQVERYNEVRFPRRGRYVMVCFFENHNAQGMYRFVRVR